MCPARILIAALAGLLAGVAAAGAAAIGVAAPLSGPSELLGRQIEAGARLAAKAKSVELVVADDACTAEGGEAAARRFIEEKTSAVIGFLCTDAIEAALPLLKDAGIAVITVGVRTESLTDRREKTGWPIFRLGARGDDERNAAAAILTRLWRTDPFAIVDDGTIYGRELAETVRATAEQMALKPVFVDTFRPQMDNQIGLVGRLRKSGATRAFAGGDGSDIATMGRDARKLGADIVFAGGEALRAQGDLPYAIGTLMIAQPEWAEVADKSVLDAFADANVLAEGYALPAYAAVEVAVAAGEAAAAMDTGLVQALTDRDFATAIGPVRFDGKGDLTQNPYRAFRFDGTRFVPMETP